MSVEIDEQGEPAAYAESHDKNVGVDGNLAIAVGFVVVLLLIGSSCYNCKQYQENPYKYFVLMSW